MRVLYDHQAFSLQDAGGVSRYHYELIRNFPTLSDLQIELLMGANASVLPFPELRNSQTKVLGWRTRIRPGYLRYAINESMYAVVTPIRGKLDIYHTMLYRAIPFVRRSRLVVTHHDCTHERFPQMFHNASFVIKRKRELFSRADAIICVSESSRRDLLNFYDVEEEKTHVVHHGFSPLQVEPSSAKPAEVSPNPYLLYVGSRSQYKNFGLLLEAFACSGLSGEFRLMVVGGGAFSTDEQARISRLGLGNHITLAPKAGDALLAAAYSNAALLVYPSLYEGFGFPPLEAMSLGCPVLVYRSSSLPEVCGDAAFYFDTPEPDELSRVLVSTLEHDEELARKRRQGTQQVKLYDWGRTARSTLEVYRALSNG